MNLGRVGKALLLSGAASVIIGTAACTTGAPVIPRDPCRTLPTDTDTDTDTGRAATASPDAALSVSGPIQLPVRPGTTTHTSGFGARWGTQHQGDDLAGPVGTPILAALDGIVVAAGSSGEGPGVGFENWVIIDSNVDGSPVSTVYGHMFADGIHVTAGQQVTAGEHIADIGNAGSSTGPHLHFEYWQGGRLQGGTPIDPVTVLPEIAQQNRGAQVTVDDHDQDSEGDQDSDIRLVSVSRSTADCSGFGMAGGGELAFGAVPAEFEPWLRRAGGVCPEIDSSLLAAQLQQENNFRYGPNAPVSPAGAMGPAQFMPGTWATWGKDHDGDGTVDPNSIGDAVLSQAHFMCALHQDVSEVPGDPIALVLAAYNAGPGAVLMHRGIPPYAETQNYVAKITAARAAFTNPNSRGRFLPNASGDNGQVVAAAREYLGTPYVWGGGTGGPTGGGFDCSGLTSFAVHAASAGRVSLPRTSEQQWTVGVEVPIEQAQPGDLVFGSWGPNGPGHVGIYSGDGQMVHAPTTGEVVTEAPLQGGMKARRVM